MMEVMMVEGMMGGGVSCIEQRVTWAAKQSPSQDTHRRPSLLASWLYMCTVYYTVYSKHCTVYRRSLTITPPGWLNMCSVYYTVLYSIQATIPPSWLYMDVH